MKSINKFCLGIFVTSLIIFCSNVFAQNSTPKNGAYPGGVVVLPLSVTSKEQPKVYFNHHRTIVIKDKEDDKWTAIVGIPLKAKPGQQHVTIQNGSLKINQTFVIQNKEYPLTHITIRRKKTVTPNPELARKIKKQIQFIRKILKSYHDTEVVYMDFRLPVKGRKSSPFGQRRIYNKVRKGRHTGLDIAAPTGTPIVAAANGKVIATGRFIITGNTVFVGHGQGLITFYAHMNKIMVKPGQIVRQGEKLGTVGSTGRSTGPHVHWGTVINGVKVNPLLFVHQRLSELK